MSWLSENYEKAALGVAAVTVLAVGAAIFTGGGDMPEPNKASNNNTVEIPQRAALTTALEKLSSVNAFESKVVHGNEVRSFVAFPLYSIKGQEGIKTLTDDFAIHPGMPLKWWKDYNLEDYRRDDGPDLDADKDGFTNREEYDGKTDPTDKASHPDYITKLQSTGASDAAYEMNWTKLNADLGNFTFKYKGARYYGTQGVGGKFPDKFKKAPAVVGRFEILKKGQDPDKSGESGEYYLIKDSAKDQNNEFKLYYSKKEKFQDWTATFLLDIAGLNDSFTVAEGDSFSLPYDEKAEVKPYKFKSKKDNIVEIEYDHDGEKAIIELNIK